MISRTLFDLPPHIQDKIFTEPMSGCWLWVGANSHGYGNIKFNSKYYRAHRFIYECLRGEVDRKMVLDHLCRNPLCTNPDHLEIVTHKENVLRGISPSAANRRKTHCSKGHSLLGENVKITPFRKGGVRRRCLICSRDYSSYRNITYKAMIAAAPKPPEDK